MACSAAVVYSSSVRSAIPGSPNLAWIISPCSVIRRSPVHRPRGLGLDREVGRAAAATHGAAAPVEQRQVHAALAAGSHHRLLRGVQLPRGGQATAVLGRIRVADHDLLPAADPLAIPGQVEQLPQRGCRAAQVVDGLEQRDDGKRGADPGLLLQELHREHVRRCARHGDDVGAERAGGLPGGHAKRLEHLAHRRVRFEVEGIPGRSPLQSLQKESLTFGLVPIGVGSEAQPARHRIESLGVARRILAQVETHEGQPETGQLPLQVEQASVGNPIFAGLEQRAAAQSQRLGQFLAVLVDRLLAGFASGQPGLDVSARRAQPIAHAAQVRTVRLANLAHAGSELAPGLDHRQLVAQCVHLAFETIGRDPARQQADFLGDFRRDVGIAVAVAAHPRTETQRRRVDGKRAPGQLEQRPIDVTQEARHGVARGPAR